MNSVSSEKSPAPVKKPRIGLISLLKITFKAIVLYIALTTILRAGGLLFRPFTIWVSLHSRLKPATWLADEFLKKFGARNDAMEILTYYRNVMANETTAGEDVFYALHDKYPEMRDIYVAYLVDGTLDAYTNPSNRNQLIRVLSKVTDLEIKEMQKNHTYEDMGPYQYEAVAKITEWWEKRNVEKLAAAQTAMKKDPYYAGEKKIEKKNASRRKPCSPGPYE